MPGGRGNSGLQSIAVEYPQSMAEETKSVILLPVQGTWVDGLKSQASSLSLHASLNK